MCTFMSYGKSETIGHKIKGKDKKKFINLKGNSFTAFLVTFIQHSVAFFVPREVIWMKKKELDHVLKEEENVLLLQLPSCFCKFLISNLRRPDPVLSPPLQ